MYAAAQVGEAFDGLQASARGGREGFAGRDEEVAECFARAASHASAQLVQFAQAECLCIVDDYGVDVRHVDAAFDDSGGNEHVVVVIGKVDNHLFEFFGLHLSVSHHHACVGHQAVHHLLEVCESVDVIVNDEYLSVSRHLEVDGFAHYVVVERVHRGEYGVAVGGWCGDCAQVASAHQRELQGARYGCGAHG